MCEWPCYTFPECAERSGVSQRALIPVSLAWDWGFVSNRARTEPWTHVCTLIKLRMESQVSHWLSLGICFSEFVGPESWEGHFPLSWTAQSVDEERVGRMLSAGKGLQLFYSGCAPQRNEKKNFFFSFTVGSVKVMIWYICCRWSLGKETLWLKKVAATYMQIHEV